MGVGSGLITRTEIALEKQNKLKAPDTTSAEAVATTPGTIGKQQSERVAKSFKEILMKLKEQEEIEKFRKQMNFPAEVERTPTINIGSGSQSTDEETTSTNKGSTYNRNSKRGTRLVRAR